MADNFKLNYLKKPHSPERMRLELYNKILVLNLILGK